MVKVIMHGCNGKMGQTIAGLIAADEEIEIVAGVDAKDEGKNPFPVFSSIRDCTAEADAVIDFSVAAAGDALLGYCVAVFYTHSTRARQILVGCCDVVLALCARDQRKLLALLRLS